MYLPPHRPIGRSRGRRRLVAGLLLLLVVPLALPPGGAFADPRDVTLRLSRARDKELDQRDFPTALQMYRELLEGPDLEAPTRGAALLGVGRCLTGLSRIDDAEKVWTQIAEDEGLPVDVREQAQEQLNQLQAGRSRVDPDAAREEDQRRLAQERVAKADGLVVQARRVYEEGRYQLALQLCLQALSWVPTHAEASALAANIRKTAPDLADLLRTLMKFANTTSVQAFNRLKNHFQQLDRNGRDFYKAEDYTHADEAFREAIGLIDNSEFLADLKDERTHAIRWLRLTIEKAGEKGIALGEPPPLPDPGSASPGFQRRFYDLLSEVFAARPDEEDPLVLYTALPAPVPLDVGEKGLATRGFPAGLVPTRADGGIRRAAWAERWIRANIGLGWSLPSPSGRVTGPPRILDRFGDMLIVQHSPSVHAKVRDLLEGFPDGPAPVAVDVALIAASTPGGTRLSTRLGLRAGPRESGHSLITSTHLLEECLPLVANLQGVHVLGTARLTMGGRSSATLEITEHVSKHPAYAGLPIPKLLLSPEDARYGLWVEIFAEDLARAPGARRAAFGIRATTRVPLGTVVLPKSTAESDHTRVPRPMAEQSLAVERIVPHAGTLVVQGLSNPFPQSAVTHGGLILLLGVRPVAADDGTALTPDPPRTTPSLGNPEGTEEREYDLGPLANEVTDELIDQGWPRRVASTPVPPATLRRAREAYLGAQLGSTWSKLAAPGKPSPVTVRGRYATARLTPERHASLQRAVEVFRLGETALYRVDVVSSETTEQGLAEWLKIAKAEAFTPRTYVLTTAAGIDAIDQRVRAPIVGSSLYVMQSRLLARATQKVAARNLHALTIVEDLRFWRHTDGTTQRVIPILGTAEEGFIVLVRPWLEKDGRRRVSVNAQAARLRALEPMRLPEVETEEARITVPRHFDPQSSQVTVPLGNQEAVLLTMPTPEGTGRVIVVMVRVQQVR